METELFDAQAPEQEFVEALPESPWQRDRRRLALALGAAAAAGGSTAIALFLVKPELVLAAVLGLGYLALVLVSPFAGLVGYLACEFLRPGESYPALAAIHIQRLAILAVFGAWLLGRAVRRDEPLVGDRQNWTMFVLLLVAACSIPNPYWMGRSVEFTIDFAKMGLVYMAVINLVNNARRLRMLVWSLALLVGYVAITGIMRYSGGTDVELSGETMRAGASSIFLGNSNDLAVALLAFMPLVIYLLRTERGLGWLLGLGLLGTYGWSLVCTGSRGGLLGLLAVCIGVWATSRRKLLGIVLLAFALLAGWTVAPQTYRDRMASMLQGADPDGSFRGRVEAWKAGVRMISARPLLGVGAGDFPVAYHNEFGPKGERPAFRSAHSLWFQTAGELGVAGLLTLGWFGWVLVSGLRGVRRTGAEAARPLADALLISLAGVAVAGSFAAILWYPYLYLIAAMGVVLRQVHGREQAVESHVRDLRPV